MPVPRPPWALYIFLMRVLFGLTMAMTLHTPLHNIPSR